VIRVKGRHHGTKTGIGHHFGLWIVRFERSILRVDLGLRLCERCTRCEAGNHLPGIPTRMALHGTTIFSARRERKVQARLGGEESEAGRQDTNDGSSKSVHTELLPDCMGVGIEMLPPVGVGENHNFVGLKRGFFIRKTAPHHRTGPKRGEKIRRYSGNLLAFRCASLAGDCCTVTINSERREGGNMATAFVVVGYRGPVAIDAGFGVCVEYGNETPGLGKR
jgi:hypothetical protein